MTAMRRSGAASAAVLLSLSASMVAAHAFAPNWSRRAGLDVWNLSALEAQYRAATDQHHEVQAYAEDAAARRTVADQIASKLIADPAHLAATADELLELFQRDQGMRVTLESVYPHVPTNRLRFARHAIGRVTRLLVNDPTRQAAVLSRLEAEYRALTAPPESPHAP